MAYPYSPPPTSAHSTTSRSPLSQLPPQYQHQYQPPPPVHTPGPQSPPPAQPQSFYRYQSYPQQPHSAGHVPPSPSYSQSPPPPQAQPASGGASSPAAYTPVSYQGHARSASAEQFYGSLLDANSEPTELFARLSDALFFFLDHNCDVPGLRGTGLIEPAKYVWMMLRNGDKQEDTAAVPSILKSYYDLARVPYHFAPTRTGEHVVVLDRQGWLHLHVFDATADPDEAFKDWTRYLANFRLADPATAAPFPTPLPRRSLPSLGDLSLKRAVEQWKVQAVVAVLQERKTAEMQIVHAMTARQQSLILGRNANASYPAYAGAGAGFAVGTFAQNASYLPQFQLPQAQYAPAAPVVLVENITGSAAGSGAGGDGGGSGSGGGGGGHATALDAATAALNLTNALVGAAGNSGILGALFNSQ